jgi:hypothetical protein
MLRHSFAAALAAVLFTMPLDAEITVEPVGNDLCITTAYSSDPDQVSTEYGDGFAFDITEVNGMVQVRSSNGVTVNGEQLVLVPFPSDDIIITATTSTLPGNRVAVHSLTLSSHCDDLRVNVAGDLHLRNLTVGRNSHSDVVLRGSSLIDIQEVWARRNLIARGPRHFHMESTAVGSLAYVACSSSGTSNATFINNWLGGDLSLYMGNGGNTVRFEEYIEVEGETYIQLAGGNDFVELKLADFSSFGTAWLEGGSGTDTVYQNLLRFTAGNTKSIEYFK